MTTITWMPTLSVEALTESGGLSSYRVGEHQVAIYLVAQEVFATADSCTHGKARLSMGYLIDDMIECPLHQGLFDVRTGEVRGAPCTEALKTFPTKVDNGLIYIGLSSDDL